MINWLEEAESRKRVTGENDVSADRIQLKKEAVRQNFQANQQLYDNFIKHLTGLVERVNNLPMEDREPFAKLTLKSKDSKLDNHFYYLSSSRRIQKRLYKNLFKYFKKYNFKHIRVIYLTVSQKMGMIDVELKENLLLRVRMKANTDKGKTKSQKKKNENRKDYIFHLNLSAIDKNIAMEIIDWLVFKKEMEQISFFADRD
jgi:hypothetical protein